MKKVMIACSTCFYDKIDEISKELIKLGFDIIYPNGYNEENEWRDDFNEEEYVKFFKKMFANSRDKTCKTDILLVLNFDKVKNGKVLSNYIGASTFLEIYEASMNNKKVYLMNPIPDNLLYEEIKGCGVEVINCDLNKLKEEI